MSVRRLPRRLLSFTVAALLTAPAATSHAGSTILLVNLDAPGEGLNDATPVVSQGANPGATIGEARLAAVELAAALWAGALTSEVPIVVGVSFDPLGGTTNAAPLGLGGATDVFRDFAGAPAAGVWYPAALADRLAGVDLGEPGATDLEVAFNSDVDGHTVLGTSRFYYGFDGAPPAGDVDFLSAAVHEIGHGLGFATFVDVETGAKLFGFDDAYLLHLERHGASPPDFPSMTDAERAAAIVAAGELHWTGPQTVAVAAGLAAGTGADGHVEMHAPDPPLAKTSLVHFASSLAPDDFMEPFYSAAKLDLALALAVLDDLGWGTAPQCFVQPTP